MSTVTNTELTSHSPRYDGLDALRGCAVVFMIAFHMSYDLNYFGLAQFELYTHPFWLHARTFIVTLFVTIAGASLYYANKQGIGRGFWRREAILLACAVLISAGTWQLFGDTWIFFGVLHFMWVGSLLAAPLLRVGNGLVVLGVIFIGVGNGLGFAFFDQQPWQWVGLMTHKPYTEDYVPLLPWFGVLLLGVWIGSKGADVPLIQTALPAPAWQPLLWLGRHSLIVYMLHQPLLFGLFWLGLSIT